MGEKTSENAPLGQALEVVATGTGGLEAGNTEPAGLAVIPGPAVAGDGVLEHFVSRAGGLQLGRVGQVADDGDAGDATGGGGAEGPRSDAGGRSDTAKGGGHDGRE